jgi:hypothetical protein
MTNLGVYGNINDCRIKSLNVRPALHWLAKQGPVTEGVSGGRAYTLVRKLTCPYL